MSGRNMRKGTTAKKSTASGENPLAANAKKQQAAAQAAKRGARGKENKSSTSAQSTQPKASNNQAPTSQQSNATADQRSGGNGGAMQDVGNSMADELAALKAALAAVNTERDSLKKKLSDGPDQGSTPPKPPAKKDPIPRPKGSRFNLQQAMGLGGSKKKRMTYKALVRHVRELTNQARINWETKWANIPPKEKADLFSVAKARHPFLGRFANDWATEELVKQYIRNKHKYAMQQGHIPVPEGFSHLKENAAKRGSGSRRSRADIELESILKKRRRTAGNRKALGSRDDERSSSEEEDEPEGEKDDSEQPGNEDDFDDDDGLYA
ncbi:hypothetical protein DXG03_001208 [Asterophora parasitica]|uniref:Uncharacterized protein n=1 Tax=Asterophora parasitica TaxID=117018 RepID=A0A9P7G3D6_9AGAR|nr:hypothetical protein DXG03_001208 [Asterophora parasitica]